MATCKFTTKQVGQLAERDPGLLNALIAYFVFEWERVIRTSPLHGEDQLGCKRVVPDYVEMFGVDQCVSYLLAAPRERRDGAPGFISEWLHDAAGEEDHEQPEV